MSENSRDLTQYSKSRSLRYVSTGSLLRDVPNVYNQSDVEIRRKMEIFDLHFSRHLHNMKKAADCTLLIQYLIDPGYSQCFPLFVWW